MGAGRRQHHAQQQAMRAANAEANRQAEMIRQQQEAERQQMEAMRKAMQDQTKDLLTPDITKLVGGTLGAQNLGIRTARSQRGSVKGLSKGLAALRIPLNIGGGSGGGLNIG